jgi:hypothetical protein
MASPTGARQKVMHKRKYPSLAGTVISIQKQQSVGFRIFAKGEIVCIRSEQLIYFDTNYR